VGGRDLRRRSSLDAARRARLQDPLPKVRDSLDSRLAAIRPFDGDEEADEVASVVKAGAAAQSR
jgi:hypothetical protein